jgi:hypothetical protein
MKRNYSQASGRRVLLTTFFLFFMPLYAIWASTNQNTVMFTYGVHKLNKADLIYHMGNNVQEYIKYKKWNAYQRQEFEEAYLWFMSMFNDPRKPYRFYMNEFSTLIDTEGQFSDVDRDNYYYNSEGVRITGSEYNALKPKKQKDFSPFYANKHVCKFLDIIAKGMVKQQQEGK